MINIKEIDSLTLKNKLNTDEKFVLIDVREQSEIEICKIKESIHILETVMATSTSVENVLKEPHKGIFMKVHKK